MKTIFNNFFSDVASLCGHEKTFHASFCHQLLLAGLPKTGFAPEYRLSLASRDRTDIVLFAEPDKGSWKVADKPRMAIEFKGGAYGTRNALRDTIDADGHCDDMDKLLPYRKQGMECWFVCIDVVELGISLSPMARERVAGRCKQLGINFAYYAQTETNFMLCQGGKMEKHALANSPVSEMTQRQHWQDCFTGLPELMLNHSGSEDTYTGLLYHALRQTGFGADQLSLETYFNCAKGDSRMQARPDLCIFDKNVKGRFNLYRGGNAKQSNDGIKIGNLRALVEVKGSSATEKLSDAAFSKQITKDMQKLVDWRTRFADSGYLSAASSKSQPDYIMLAVDNRLKPMRDIELAPLRQLAKAQDIHFHYLSQ